MPAYLLTPRDSISQEFKEEKIKEEETKKEKLTALTKELHDQLKKFSQEEADSTDRLREAIRDYLYKVAKEILLKNTDYSLAIATSYQDKSGVKQCLQIAVGDAGIATKKKISENSSDDNEIEFLCRSSAREDTLDGNPTTFYLNSSIQDKWGIIFVTTNKNFLEDKEVILFTNLSLKTTAELKNTIEQNSENPNIFSFDSELELKDTSSPAPTPPLNQQVAANILPKEITNNNLGTYFAWTALITSAPVLTFATLSALKTSIVASIAASSAAIAFLAVNWPWVLAAGAVMLVASSAYLLHKPATSHSPLEKDKKDSHWTLGSG